LFITRPYIYIYIYIYIYMVCIVCKVYSVWLVLEVAIVGTQT
jgi:hypothetical protein